MKNELLTIGPFTVYGYGLMIAIGIVAGCLTAEYRARKQGLDSEQIFPMVLWCLVGGFLCAKLLFWITEWKSIIQDPGFMMETLSSGFVVFGGIIGGILTGFLYMQFPLLFFVFLWFYCSECYQCLCPALLSRYTRSTEISAGDTPEIRDAWPMDTGL